MGEIIEFGRSADGNEEQTAHTQAEEPQQREMTPADSYVVAVAQALDHKKASSVCRECASAVGWGDWNLLPQPVAVQVFEANVATLAAQLTCKRCGYMRFYSLPFLGVNVEQRRIITPP